MRLAVSAEYIIRPAGLDCESLRSGQEPSRRSIIVGGAKQLELFRDLETSMHHGIKEALERLPRGEGLLGIGVEPWLPAEASGAIPVRIKVTMLDLPTSDLDAIWRRIRAIIPLISALAAATPFDSCHANGIASNALMNHIHTCQREGRAPISADRRFRYGRVEKALPSAAPRSPVAYDSSTGALQISLWEVQECARSNMAVIALLSSLLRTEGMGLDASEEDCTIALGKAAEGGTAQLKEELWTMYELAGSTASAEERMYLSIIRERIDRGSLGETLPKLVQSKGMDRAMDELSKCLRTNRPFLPRED
ncbi:MAG: hypothetical protein A4E32_00349 [Methanomassiliicoccales archaeon PtaU1.Bin124]|nr:MAG: hypothetical protein A4E32_00349 [Methanomassiliicoccales archaeon PtaU1.Bin124]